MRNSILALMAVSVSGCQPQPTDPRGVDHDETLLTVSATGRTDNRPDEARLQLGVQSLAATAGAASAANRAKMEQVTRALERLGVKPDDLQTRSLNLQRIDYGRERGQFRAENIVEVKIRDMSKVGEAVTAVTEAGANILSGPELRISNREAASRSAYAAAYRAARSRAEAYAQAADLKVSRVLAIHDGGESYMPPPYARSGIAVEQAAPPPTVSPVPFNPGVSTTEVRVRVDFALAK